ncbi:MAG: YebC/PmpR family DNA-binding transcriptional regulator [Candidatus Vogelbacteria bacterium]|nr:YebC/PmpR family DNA-binding transcriptional regulator [Candidatus Vogelbacteria bacterium]
MSGHNKFSKIKRQKGIEDAKKSKVFSVLVKQLTNESHISKGDRNSSGLRIAIDKAKAANMPGDNIDRAIAKGAGIGAGSMEEILCEAYGPGGVAIIIEGITDSKNRTINEIKFLLSEHTASLGPQGSVVWAFQKTQGGWIPTTKLTLSDEDKAKLEGLIVELEENPDIENVYTNTDLPAETE